MRLRTQLIIGSVSLILTLTAASLLIVQRTVRAQVRKQVADNVISSERALQTVQSEREDQLLRTAALLSELPTLKALMATQDRSTVQDGSEAFWNLSGGDAFLLATTEGRLLAKHFARDNWTDESTMAHLRLSLERGEPSDWWIDHGKVYWVFFHALRAGAQHEARDLGIVAIGYKVDQRLAVWLANTSRSEIAVLAGQSVIASTAQVPSGFRLQSSQVQTSQGLQELNVGGRMYSLGVVALNRGSPAITCLVMVPENASAAFLARVNRTILILALAAVILGGALCSLIARAMTSPLENVVSGIGALAKGDYDFKINAHGSSEVEHLASAFSAMRLRLLESQKNQLAAERVATLGRTASSVSHDLRHYLAAVVANAEFLYEAETLKLDRDEIYREIKTATEQMVDLIDSLRELSREQTSLQCVSADIAVCIQRAIDAVNARQDFRNCSISVQLAQDTQGVFDPLKIERVFFNLILNACEAMSPGGGSICVDVRSSADTFTIRVQDSGHGISASVRENLFEPFVSAGNQNGTGLGLAIVKKILQDHRGSIQVETTSERGTTMILLIPRACATVERTSLISYHGNL